MRVSYWEDLCLSTCASFSLFSAVSKSDVDLIHTEETNLNLLSARYLVTSVLLEAKTSNHATDYQDLAPSLLYMEQSST